MGIINNPHYAAIRAICQEWERWQQQLPGQRVGTPTLWRDISWHLRQLERDKDGHDRTPPSTGLETTEKRS